MTRQSRTEMLRLLEAHGVAPRKALGQHFLADPNIVERIVSVAEVGRGDQVVEIGAGTGTLTRALAERGARVVAYEVDEGLRPVLDDALAGLSGVEVRFADAAAVDLAAELGPGPWTMVANLPYGVGTTILLTVLREVPAVTRMVVMVQLEVARRLVAGPGSKEYGLPSVVVGLHARARIEFTVAPQVFVPPPQVTSAVVRLDRVEAPEVADRAVELAAAGFGGRRKMLRRSLASVLSEPRAALAAAGIDETARAEDLAPSDWVRLAEVADA